MKIAQLVPALHSGDAIGNNILALHRYFTDRGDKSTVFYIDADQEIASEGSHCDGYKEWIGNETDAVTILHYALPSVLNQMFIDAKSKKLLVYHNITPPEFLRGYPHLQQISRVGREELARLKLIPDIALADSEYNRQELENMGFIDTREMPIMLDFDSYSTRKDPIVARQFTGEDIVTFLFVGRITPNKCQHDVIKLYGFYKRYVNPRCRLILVGKYDGFEQYLWECQKMVNRLKLGDVHITGRVTHEELLAYYNLADVFISMSEHEGFGVPLIESMILDLPVIAYNAAAVPYTLAGAGIRFTNKENWLELSELLNCLISDQVFRNKIIKSQQKRLSYFKPDRLKQLWGSVITEISS